MSVGRLGLPIITIDTKHSFTHNFETNVYLAFSDAAKGPLGQATLQRLNKDDRFRKFESRMLAQGSGATRLEAATLAAWYLWRANEVGLEEATTDLENFLNSDDIVTMGALWLYGVAPSERFPVTEDIDIVPTEQMPNSGDKEHFLTSSLSFRPEQRRVPTAALVRQYKIKKLFDEASFTLDEEEQKAFSSLAETALLLNCFPGVCCFAAYQTSYTLPSVPLGPLGGSGGGWPIYDVIPQTKISINSKSEVDVSALASRFRQLNERDKLALTRSLYRLGQAKARLNRHDRALDLGIALEMVLLQQEHRNQEMPTQLSLQFRLRGSWLLAETPDERRSLYGELSKIYSLRSQVAHNGVYSELEKMNEQERTEMTARHERIAERVLQRLILKGIPNNWTSIILGIP